MARQIPNPYPGINAHFNSNLQNNGTWPEFHTIHIGDIAKTLKSVLLPLGYTVGVEQSLQIWRGDESSSPRRPDVTIFDTQPRISRPASTSSAASMLTMPILELIDLDSDDQFVPALVISKRVDDEPIVWIELVSPSNKPPQSGFIAYDQKRKEALLSGLVFVEIDYLHQQPPTFRSLHDYTQMTANSGDGNGDIRGHGYPYRIVVIDPRPEIAVGDGHLYEFGVDETIPTVTIPLTGGEKVDFDFGLAYTKTFEEGLYGLELDYSLSPTAFESYHKRDRGLILTRMAELMRSS